MYFQNTDSSYEIGSKASHFMSDVSHSRWPNSLIALPKASKRDLAYTVNNHCANIFIIESIASKLSVGISLLNIHNTTIIKNAVVVFAIKLYIERKLMHILPVKNSMG